MTTNDRRSGTDRRSQKRYSVRIETEWEGSVGRKSGTISDINTQGCFVLCSGDVQDGENVKIFFPLTDGRKIQGSRLDKIIIITNFQKQSVEIFFSVIESKLTLFQVK